MFTFFLKKPKIVLDCFTAYQEIIDLFPIIHAGERPPAFWKKLQSTTKYEGITRGTMRTCPGVNSLFNTGFIIQNWSDYYINVDNNQLECKPENRRDLHHPLQWGGPENLKDFHHVKLISPWRIKEKTGVSFLFTNCFWQDTTFRPIVVNGIVEYKYQYTTSVNMLVPKNMFPRELTIPAGKELAHVVPLSEKDIEIKMHKISHDEYRDMDGYDFAFHGQYYKKKKILKANEK